MPVPRPTNDIETGAFNGSGYGTASIAPFEAVTVTNRKKGSGARHLAFAGVSALLALVALAAVATFSTNVRFAYDDDGSIELLDTTNLTQYKFPIAFGRNMPYYATGDLSSGSSTATRAVIAIHGTNRDADNYFSRISTACTNAQADETTFLLAPGFVIASDSPATDTLFWDYNSRWKRGDYSSSTVTGRMSSFQVIDDMIASLADAASFPKLETIVVTGHSAGGQFVQRYALGTNVDKTHTGIAFRFVPMNPSSYAFLDDQRPTDVSASSFGTSFAVPSAAVIANCTKYNEWKYGLADLNTYMTATGKDAALAQYKERDVRYFLGAHDNDPDSSYLDKSCSAELQGESRLIRGINFYGSVQNHYESHHHKKVVVPGVGHSSSKMFKSSEGLKHLFDYVALTVAPTTVAPTTAATTPATTVAPTTVAPTTVAPTTVAPTTVAPSTTQGDVPGAVMYKFPVTKVNGRSMPYYASASLTTGSPATNAVIVFHSGSRDGQGYYNKIASAESRAGKSGTYILAPRFRIKGDAPGSDIVFWDYNSRWKRCDYSSSSVTGRVSSCTVIDDMIVALSDRSLFPNLKTVVLTGHGSGSNLVARFALATTVDTLEALGHLHLRFAPMNANSFAYLDPRRSTDLTGHAANAVFSTPPANTVSACTAYDNWRYGLSKLNTYMKFTTKATALALFQHRDVVVMVGATATHALETYLDKSCSAELQGISRWARSRLYHMHVSDYYDRFGNGEPHGHSFHAVPGVDYSSNGMFRSAMAKTVLFE